MSEKNLGSILIILAMAIFGFYGIFVRFLSLSPQLILFFNSLFVVSILFFAFLKTKENFKIKKHRIIIFLLGLAFLANNLCYFKASQFIFPQISFSLPFFYLFLFALIFGILATFLHFQGIKRVKAQEAGILAYTEPLFGTIYAFFLLKEIPTIFSLIGGGLIILGGCLIFKTKG